MKPIIFSRPTTQVIPLLPGIIAMAGCCSLHARPVVPPKLVPSMRRRLHSGYMWPRVNTMSFMHSCRGIQWTGKCIWIAIWQVI